MTPVGNQRSKKTLVRRRRFFVVLIVVALCIPAEAQQAKKVPRIGFLSSTGDSNDPGATVKAFQQGLRELGYIEGKNILVEYRYVEGKPDRIPGFVSEFVQLKFDVLVIVPLTAVRIAKQATKTIPIVMVIIDDPVAAGLVDSLAHPGANITGLTSLGRALSGKRLELLKETVPGISRVAILWDTDAPGTVIGFKEYETTAHTLKIPVQSLEVRGPNPDLEGAFQAATKARASALITITNPVLTPYSKQIADLAIKNRLPSMYESSRYVEAGGLMSYSSNLADLYRRAAVYVDKILKGAKPADLPIEQPTKFELVINLKTAKQIGVNIPQSVLFRADKVIK